MIDKRQKVMALNQAAIAPPHRPRNTSLTPKIQGNAGNSAVTG